MHTLHLSIGINAPREKVWHTMLDDATYRQWTTSFNPGSYYKGSWEKGSKILFLGDNEDGKGSGMVSRIEESRKPEFVSIEHLGVMMEGKEVMDDPNFKEWAGAHENYTFNEKDGGTELVIDTDMSDSMPEMKEMWEKALRDLKALCEQA